MFGEPSSLPAGNEIGSPLEALDDLGRPVNFGWARGPLWHYDSSLLRASPRRFNAQDRYFIQSPGFFIVMQIIDGGALGYAGVTLVSLAEKKRSSQTLMIPLSLGAMGLPDSGDAGRARIWKGGYLVEFTAMEGGTRIIRVDIPKFEKRRYLRGELVLTPPPGGESLVTHLPWRTDRGAFALTRRSPWYAVEGIIQFGSQEIVFPQGKSFALYEWSRGVRPRANVYQWAGAAGIPDNRPGGPALAFTVGYGGADSLAGTENAFFSDGRLHKLGQVTFHLSPANGMSPWRFTSSDERLEMTFAPLEERSERKSWFFHSLQRRQFFGFFAGRVVLDGGEAVEFQGLPGMAERGRTVR
jgi:hypothetical protein